MDATLRDTAAEFAKEFASNISTQQELSDVMQLMSKAIIERILQAEMDVHLGRRRPERSDRKTATAEGQDDTAETDAEATQSPGGKRARRNRRNGNSTKRSKANRAR